MHCAVVGRRAVLGPGRRWWRCSWLSSSGTLQLVRAHRWRTEALFILLLAPAFFEPLRELSAAWHDRLRSGGHRNPERAADDETALPLAGTAQYARTTGTDGHLRRMCAFTTCDLPSGQPDLFNAFELHCARRARRWWCQRCRQVILLALIAGLPAPQRGRSSSRLRGHESPMPRNGWLTSTPRLCGIIATQCSLVSHVGAEAVARAVSIANLTGVVRARPHATLGEQGRGLSAGEIRRLGLARLAADPTLQLVLADEPTANLDRVTAAETIEGLLAIAQGKTLIVATHDPELITRKDRVIRIGEARVE